MEGYRSVLHQPLHHNSHKAGLPGHYYGPHAEMEMIEVKGRLQVLQQPPHHNSHKDGLPGHYYGPHAEMEMTEMNGRLQRIKDKEYARTYHFNGVNYMVVRLANRPFKRVWEDWRSQLDRPLTSLWEWPLIWVFFYSKMDKMKLNTEMGMTAEMSDH